MLGLVTRPLVIIFLTIFVNLVGFGIIIPLLPFYAETFGASPLVIGLLFAIFSLCQLVAAPALGDMTVAAFNAKSLPEAQPVSRIGRGACRDAYGAVAPAGAEQKSKAPLQAIERHRRFGVTAIAAG